MLWWNGTKMSDEVELSFYNTLSRKKERFQPIDPNNVRLYVCGPTVYDYAHIGNARPAIVFDLLFRLLKKVYGDKHVTYVRNITDVDDKINARALRDFPDLPLNEAIANVTQKTTAQYHSDIAALNCQEPVHEPRATQHIGGMIMMIENLIDRGNAYQAGGEVLFDTASMPEYGQLSGRKLEEQQAGARIAVADHKKNPSDFVLWKLSSDEEPGWDSPWGKGRPGWHIECSVMSEHHLGEVFDIHGGGLDLIFPHHENELAQSRCAHGEHKMANFWMHNGFLQVEGRKMSKSEGNFITIFDLLDTEKFGGRKWPGTTLRLAMLMTHYREPIDFSVNRLEEASSTLENWLGPVSERGDPDEGRVPPGIIAALADDLNFIRCRTEISELVKARKSASGKEAEQHANDIAATLIWLGVANAEDFQIARIKDQASRDELRAKEAGMALAEIESNIAERLQFIRNKDWDAADKIRQQMANAGIQLKDGKDPDSGERITEWEVAK